MNESSVPLMRWGAATVSGADASAFVHKFCTNDVLRLAPGQGCEAFFTDVKGRIVAHGAILKEETQLQVLLPAGNVDSLIAHLDRYVIREEVAFANQALHWGWRLLTHRESLKTAISWEPPLDAWQNAWDHCRLPVEAGLGTDARAVRCDLPWDVALLIGADHDASGQLDRRLAAAGLASADHETFETLRIEAGWPLWGIDFDDANLPQEVDRDRTAVSFKKGCYLGQETVARIDALGHVNRQLRRVQFAGDQVPTPATELLAAGEKAGVVTSACWSSRRRAPLAWAMLRRGWLTEGTPLDSPVGPCHVVGDPASSS